MPMYNYKHSGMSVCMVQKNCIGPHISNETPRILSILWKSIFQNFENPVNRDRGNRRRLTNMPK